MNNILCKIFGHRFKYWTNVSTIDINKEFRTCQNCGYLQQYRTTMHPYPPDWFTLVQRKYNIYDKGDEKW